MRSLIVISMFAATLSHAAWNGYTESRELEAPANGIERLEIDAGSGDIVVRGDASAKMITVKATIRVDDNERDALKFIEKDLVLDLKTKNGKATLDAYFDRSFWRHGEASVDIEVQIPQGLEIFVDDGSGSMHIEDVQGDVSVDDGSGSILVVGATSVRIDDGSGSVEIADVSGDVRVDDGSGNIKIRNVEGSVTIDGGSGSVQLADIRGEVYQTD
jgi:DUF4097 and DUF4098 domain-containing protein YvlB